MKTLIAPKGTIKSSAAILNVSSWLSRLKSRRKLTASLIRCSRLALGHTSRSLAVILYLYSKHICNIYKCQGVPGVAKRLKVYTVMLMQSCSRYSISPHALGVAVARTGSGLPRVIPLHHRIEIRRGNAKIIRFWLTLFGLYRVLNWPGRLKLSTITDPGVTPASGLVDDARVFSGVFINLIGGPRTLDELKRWWKPLILLTAGPTSIKWKDDPSDPPHTARRATSTASAPYDALKWILVENRPLFVSLAAWCNLTNNSEIIENITQFAKEAIKTGKKLRTSYLGGLGLKNEPGKVRVFAMVDYWTQCALAPLHDLLFEILREIPTDGTFDQEKPIRQLAARVRKGEFSFIASYDLSAATDRLPLWLQVIILNALLGIPLGNLWGELIASREFEVPKPPKGTLDGDKAPKTVRYAVGQPMGALSSWAMLALTHHFIVKWAAKRSTGDIHFKDYAVLGDDVVIANRAVANEYVRLMKSLGVGIGMHKSIVSTNGCFEFAKRFVFKGVDVSPLSIKEMDVAQKSLAACLTLVNKAVRLGEVRLVDVLYFLGYGYRTVGSLSKGFERFGKRFRWAVQFMVNPDSPFGLTKDWGIWLGLDSLKTFVHLNPNRVFKSWKDTWVRRLIDRYHTLKELHINFRSPLWLEEETLITTWMRGEMFRLWICLILVSGLDDQYSAIERVRSSFREWIDWSKADISKFAKEKTLGDVYLLLDDTDQEIGSPRSTAHVSTLVALDQTRVRNTSMLRRRVLKAFKTGAYVRFGKYLARRSSVAIPAVDK